MHFVLSNAHNNVLNNESNKANIKIINNVPIIIFAVSGIESIYIYIMDYYCKHGYKFNINNVSPHIISYLFDYYLPDEIWCHVLQYINNETLVILALTNKLLYQSIKDTISKICNKCPTYIKFTGSFIKNDKYLFIHKRLSYSDEIYQMKIIDNKPVLCIKLKLVFH